MRRSSSWSRMTIAQIKYSNGAELVVPGVTSEGRRTRHLQFPSPSVVLVRGVARSKISWTQVETDLAINLESIRPA